MSTVLILTSGILPIPALAQAENDPAGRQQIGCLRGRPLPACKSFWIVEMQGSAPVVQTSRDVQGGFGPTRPQKAFAEVLEWNLGHMVNVGSTYAVGGVVTVGTGNSDALTGLKLRVRRWLNSELSLEAEGGLLWNDAKGGTSDGVGGTAALRLNIRDQGSFYLRWDTLPLEPWIGSNSFDPGGTQHALSIGIATGSVPALVASGATGITWAVLVALAVRD